jgi:uncharacterized protein YjbI with pentapeptide repeats
MFKASKYLICALFLVSCSSSNTQNQSGEATTVPVSQCKPPDLLECENADLSGMDLSGMLLNQGNFKNANLNGANLTNTNLNSANLRFAKLKGAMMKGAQLARADVSDADLQNADLTFTNLGGTDFRRSILNGVDFTCSYGDTFSNRDGASQAGSVDWSRNYYPGTKTLADCGGIQETPSWGNP